MCLQSDALLPPRLRLRLVFLLLSVKSSSLYLSGRSSLPMPISIAHPEEKSRAEFPRPRQSIPCTQDLEEPVLVGGT